MEVQVISLCHSSERFAFLTPLVKALENAVPLESVYFPDIGGLCKAEVVLEETLDYYTDKPTGVLQFKSNAAKSEMLYRAEVTLLDQDVANGKGMATSKGLRLTMRVASDAHKKIYSTGSIELRSYACVVKQIARYFQPGAVYRKIKPLKIKKPAKEAA